MGYIAHDAAVAVVPSHVEGIVEALAAFRIRLATKHPDIAPFFVGPIPTVNFDSIYAFLPDGSKEGWGLSDTAEAYREEFVRIARGELADDDEEPYWNGGDVVHVRFGGDYGYDSGTQVISSTDIPHVAVAK